MPPPIDPCERLRNRLVQLRAQLEREINNLRNATLAADRLRIQANINRIQSQIEHERALMEEFGCDRIPPPRPDVPVSNLTVAGIEATQAIQYFRYHPADPDKSSVAVREAQSFVDEFKPSNSVPLVANKPTILRVYLDSRMFHEPYASTVTGTLQYARISGSSRTLLPDLKPVNGPVPAPTTFAINRANLNHSLNFLLPAQNCTGTLEVTVRVTDPVNPSGNTDESKTLLSFRNIGEVRIHGVLVNYMGLDAAGNPVNLAAPAGIQLVRIMEGVLRRMYPVAGFRYTGCETIQDDGNYTATAGWTNLRSRLARMSLASGGTDVYVALLPAGVPTDGIAGFGGTVSFPQLTVGGAIVLASDDGTTLSQELSHAFQGSGHVPCGNPPNPITTYPRYNGYPRGSIGEFGFDYAMPRIFSPGVVYDFMSYCTPIWVSPFTYIALMDAIAGGQYNVLTAHRMAAPPRPYLFLPLEVARDGAIRVLPGFYVPLALGGEVGPKAALYCDLLDGEGAVLESGPCYPVVPNLDPHAAYRRYLSLIPWNKAAQSLRFSRDGCVVDTIGIESESPSVRIEEFHIGNGRKNLARISWAVESTVAIRSLVRYSHDGGNSWRVLNDDVKKTYYIADLDLLPGGERCCFEVVVSSGIRTASQTTEVFAAPRKPRRPYILVPEPGATYRGGDPVVLVGGAYSPDEGTVAGAEVTWTSRLDGSLGTGHELVLYNLSPGEHEVVMTMSDGAQGQISASVRIEVGPPEC